jgi:hypothetical protein
MMRLLVTMAKATRWRTMLPLVLAAACSREEPTASGDGACGAGTNAVDVRLLPLQGQVVNASCIRLSPGNGRYLLVPQFAGTTQEVKEHPFAFGEPTSPSASIGTFPAARLAVDVGEPSASRQFEAMLRAREQMAAPVARTRVPNVQLAVARTTPTLGEQAAFSVLATLFEPARYDSVRARAVYVGARIALYEDIATPNAFSPAQWSAMGTLMDQTLAPTAEAAFGTPTDVDGNRRVIVLFTAAVNRLVTSLECGRSGFVNGFFNSEDLKTSSKGNGGEVFYSLVPDPTGAFSCAHTAAEVQRSAPVVFIHELQHMISYGEHVVRRNGAAEVPWLNEGLSHIAEELGSRVFEQRYPSPVQRARGGQMVPDSAVPYFTPNVKNAFLWLDSPMYASPIAYDAGSFGSLAERGASWLFLRWLIDRQGPNAMRDLVQTTRVGTANLEAVGLRTTSALLGDFALAVFGDSVPGNSRTSVASQWRFGSRNLRVMFADYLVDNPAGGFGFPVRPTLFRNRRGYAMRPMTMQYFVAEPVTQADRIVHFSASDLSPLPTVRSGQVSILRLPD